MSRACFFGMTNRCPRVIGRMSMNANVVPSSYTLLAGISPAAILQKTQLSINRILYDAALNKLMRAAVFAGAMLVLLAAAMACNATIGNVVVGSSPGCPDGVAPDKAEIYSGEDFYICGNVYLNGESLTSGSVQGSIAGVTDDRATVSDGSFSLHGTANVPQYGYYYINVSLEQPCKIGFENIPVEIRTSCNMLPPSTIEVVPNIVGKDGEFTVIVKNSPADIEMELDGLGTPVAASVIKGGSWSQRFPASKCGHIGTCPLHFKFVEQKHRMCTSSADVAVIVKQPNAVHTGKPSDNSSIALLTLLVIVVGTAGAIALNRYL